MYYLPSSCSLSPVFSATTWPALSLLALDRDARVRADVVTVAPDVSGYIDDVRVKNDQFVHKGDVLFVIDQERYLIALADAEAALAARQAQYLMALSSSSDVRSWLPGTPSRSKISTTPAGSRNQRPPATSRRSRRATLLL